MQPTLSRRTVLRGLGAAVSLPLFEAMLPRVARGGVEEAKPPVRMAFMYVPNGIHMPDWTPEVGRLEKLPSILQPLDAYRQDITLMSGLTLNGARSLGDGGGDHARSVAAFLTGAHPKKTDGADIKNGVSIDQVAAEKIGQLTRLPSLELGTERSAKAGRCDSGYSCLYTSNMSWRTPTSPVAKETNPAAVFDRMFGNPNNETSTSNREFRDAKRRSLLDFVLEDAGDLRKKLGVTDQRKLDEYLYAVRDIERRIASADKLETLEADVPDYPRPVGAPAEYSEHVSMMFDLLHLAFRTDTTRVATFMYTNAGSNRSYRNIGVSDGHHTLSHHGNNEEKQAKISKINKHHVGMFAGLLEKLRDTKEGDGNLLDQCMIMYGSGIADGNRHAHHDLPIMLAGKGGGTIQTGRHLEFKKDTPLTNLYLSMLDRVGASVDKLGDSSERLTQLQ